MKLITGGTGFIGARLLRALCEDGEAVRCLSRRSLLGDIECVQGDLFDAVALRAACSGVHTVFHCAGHAHAFNTISKTESEKHWQVNFEGTCQLLEAAGAAGVKVFVFLSSVKAMADPKGVCVDENWPGEPDSDYGRAKRAAEEAALEAGRRFGMRTTNLRLSMVYGAGGRGNLERMGRLVARGGFPPIPETGNHRSLVHVNDVIRAMRLVANDLRAGGRTYIVASQEAPSGRQLFDALRTAQSMPQCRWALPEFLLRSAGRVGDALERLSQRRMPLDSEVIGRLLDSAWYSSSRIEKELGWRAQVSLVEGLKEMLCA